MQNAFTKQLFRKSTKYVSRKKRIEQKTAFPKEKKLNPKLYMDIIEKEQHMQRGCWKTKVKKHDSFPNLNKYHKYVETGMHPTSQKSLISFWAQRKNQQK